MILDVNVIITDPDNDEVDSSIDLQLHNIRDKSVVDGKAVGTVNLGNFTEGLKAVVIAYLTQHGDVQEF